jgi:hypothetical protein
MEKIGLRKRRIHIGKRSIPLLTLLALALTISVASVSAAAYVSLTWTTTATVVANPKVCFYKWSDQTKVNTFSYIVNIFPNVITIDENITYALYNWDTSDHNVYFRLASENTNTTDISWMYYKVYNGGTLFSKNETNFNTPDTVWSTFYSAVASTKYMIWISIKCASGAGIGHTPSFTFEVKVENP